MVATGYKWLINYRRSNSADGKMYRLVTQCTCVMDPMQLGWFPVSLGVSTAPDTSRVTLDIDMFNVGI